MNLSVGLLNKIQTAAQLAAAAYHPTAQLPAGWEKQGEIVLRKSLNEDLLEKLLPRENEGSNFGFVAYNAALDKTVVAFRGTQPIAHSVEVLDDLECFVKHGAEEGFTEVYECLDFPTSLAKSGLDKSLMVVGHSLGASIALLFTEMKTVPGDEVYTFACPKTFNQARAAAYDLEISDSMGLFVRVTNKYDIVPDYPPFPDYRHVGTDDNKLVVDAGPLSNRHSMPESYLAGVVKLVEAFPVAA